MNELNDTLNITEEYQRNNDSIQQNVENVEKIIDSVQMWKDERVLNGYYNPIIYSMGYMEGPSAREVLEDLGLLPEEEIINNKSKQKIIAKKATF